MFFKLIVLTARVKVFCLFQDNTSPDEQIQIQLVSVPMYGILTRSQSQQEHQELREYSSFTMEDISEHRIRLDRCIALYLRFSRHYRITQ